MLVCDRFRCLLEQCTYSVLFTMSTETRFRSGMLVALVDCGCTLWESVSRRTSGSVMQCGSRCLVVHKYEVTCCEHVFNDVLCGIVVVVSPHW